MKIKKKFFFTFECGSKEFTIFVCCSLSLSVLFCGYVLVISIIVFVQRLVTVLAFYISFISPDLYEICHSRAEDRIRMIQESKDAPGSPESMFSTYAELYCWKWLCTC